ncbi:MAG: hypothetical protein U0Z53_06650 [Blastocatellia bacterium]
MKDQVVAIKSRPVNSHASTVRVFFHFSERLRADAASALIDIAGDYAMITKRVLRLRNARCHWARR